MIRYFIRSTGAHLRQAPSLFLLTVCGVALGVASVLAIQIINRNAIGAFSAGIQAISGEADLSVVGRATAFDESLFPRVLGMEGVAASRNLLCIIRIIFISLSVSKNAFRKYDFKFEAMLKKCSIKFLCVAVVGTSAVGATICK